MFVYSHFFTSLLFFLFDNFLSMQEKISIDGIWHILSQLLQYRFRKWYRFGYRLHNSDSSSSMFRFEMRVVCDFNLILTHSIPLTCVLYCEHNAVKCQHEKIGKSPKQKSITYYCVISTGVIIIKKGIFV